MHWIKSKSFWGYSILAVTAITLSIMTVQSKDVPSDRSVPEDPIGIYSRLKSGTIVSEAGMKLKVITLTDENTVEFEDEVTYESSKALIAKLKQVKNTDRIYLLITSPGGSVLSGAMVVETVQGSKIPVDTVCVGMCASMGAQIHAVGVRRYMTNKSVLMYHPASGGVQGDFNNMGSRLAFYKRYVTKMDMYIAERAGIPYEEFKSRVRDELWIDAQDATFDGFNDNVVYLDDKRSPKLSIFDTFGSSGEQKVKRPDPLDAYFQTKKSPPNQPNGTKSK